MSKTILITGSGRGFGNLIAKALADQGHGVIAAIEERDDYTSKGSAELRSTPNVEIITMDLASEESIADNVQQVLSRYGPIDILINNTEIMGIGPIEATSISQIKYILDIGLFGVIRVIQAVLPDMRRNRCGVILNMCCGPSLFSLPFLIPQTLSKMGIVALSEGLQAELKDEGIECISVLVGNCVPESVNNKQLNADRTEITKAYEIKSKSFIYKLKQLFLKREPIEEKCQQSVIFDILNLLNMKNGTRPGMIAIDNENEQLIRELIATRTKLKENWLEKIGIKN